VFREQNKNTDRMRAQVFSRVNCGACKNTGQAEHRMMLMRGWLSINWYRVSKLYA
jgi:hypothetical protein